MINRIHIVFLAVSLIFYGAHMDVLVICKVKIVFFAEESYIYLSNYVDYQA